MRALSPTLQAAQQQGSGVPCVKVEAVNRFAGPVRLDWERLYTGGEADNIHAVTMAGDGSMIRIRVSPGVDGRKVYRQRIVNPAPGSDFSTWSYSGQMNCIAVAAASTGTEVLLFLVTSARELKYIRSFDFGVTWETPLVIDYLPASDTTGLAVAVKPNGDLAVFICLQETLYVKQRTIGIWQPRTAWTASTGFLTGVAAGYGADWDIVITGEDPDGNRCLWSLVYGDGESVATGSWSPLTSLASAPADGDISFQGVFTDVPDVHRLFYVEKFTGTEAYSRIFRSQLQEGSAFISSLWLEPVPFDYQSEYGTAVTHFGDFCWLSVPSGVWRARLTELRADLSHDVIDLELEAGTTDNSVQIFLRNDDGRYSSPPLPLGEGCRIDVSPGYRTGLGDEFSTGQTFIVESCEYISEGGKAGFFLYGTGGWSRIRNWTASCQFRFNKNPGEKTVIQILEFVLARAGIGLDCISCSSLITGFCPDFTIRAGSAGESIVDKLLSLVPDIVFVEGDTAWLIDPSATDPPVYAYGRNHPVVKGTYRKASWKTNRVTVEGYDASGGNRIVKDSFAWDQIARQQVRAERLDDRNIGTVETASERGTISLKSAETASVNGTIEVPVNCGQQVFDVIEITDERAGLVGERKRVEKLTLRYRSERGEYRQTIRLGAV